MDQQIETKAKRVLDTCLARKIKLGSCESFTGGGFANLLTNCRGASQVFLGGIVCYSNETKVTLLKVDPEVLKNYGAISAECTGQMAEHGSEILMTDFCVAFSGNADRDISENQPPFFSFIALNYQNQTNVFPFSLPDTPAMNRKMFKDQAINFALDKILELLN